MFSAGVIKTKDNTYIETVAGESFELTIDVAAYINSLKLRVRP